jgi:hypothetical protein
LELAISLRGAVTNGIDSSRKFDGEFARGSSTYAGTGTLRIGAGEQRLRHGKAGRLCGLEIGISLGRNP